MKFSKHLILQPLCLVLFMVIVLFFFDELSADKILWAVGAGSLASSSCIVFGKPSSSSAQPKNILFGYTISVLIGLSMRLIVDIIPFFQTTFHTFHWVALLAALAVGLCLFITSIVKLEHPPASGMALVLVLNIQDYSALIVIIAAAIALSLIKFILKKWLVDLT